MPTQYLHALQTVIQVLDKQGVLATLKVCSVPTSKSTGKIADLPSDIRTYEYVWHRQAQLRACVFAVVDGEEGKSYGTGLSRSFMHSELCQNICGKPRMVLWLQILSKELTTLRKQS